MRITRRFRGTAQPICFTDRRNPDPYPIPLGAGHAVQRSNAPRICGTEEAVGDITSERFSRCRQAAGAPFRPEEQKPLSYALKGIASSLNLFLCR